MPESDPGRPTDQLGFPVRTLEGDGGAGPSAKRRLGVGMFEAFLLDGQNFSSGTGDFFHLHSYKGDA